MSSAYLLVSHGSRDRRPQAAIGEIAQKWQQQMETRSHSTNITDFSRVGSATLELNVLPLHLQIKEFGEQAIAAGYETLEILPLFLLPGVHVMEDIPSEVAQAQTLLPSRLKIKLHPYIGAHPQWKQIFAQQIATLDTPTTILFSHGSRRLQGNQPVEELASELGITPAYWSISPTLNEQVAKLANTGYSQIGIQPYFLFPGGITDAIAQTVTDLQAEYPKIHLQLGQIIDSSAILELLSTN
ncbi:sirohydrochlorin chelatase [Merismopedia glauca]|uniref:sirohydrochlorin chelatase n=1 Tax=Merismopedia glauca TaxID=292586 RepID=UPI0030D8C04C